MISGHRKYWNGLFITQTTPPKLALKSQLLVPQDPLLLSAMVCHVTSCSDIFCHVQYSAMFCHILSVVLFSVVIRNCFFMNCYILSYFVMFHNVLSCFVMFRHDPPCSIMSCQVQPYSVMFRYLLTCYVMLRHGRSYYIRIHHDQLCSIIYIIFRHVPHVPSCSVIFCH